MRRHDVLARRRRHGRGGEGRWRGADAGTCVTLRRPLPALLAIGRSARRSPGMGIVRVRVLAAVAPICLLAVLAGSQVRYLGWWLNWRSMIEGASASLVSGVPDPDVPGLHTLPVRRCRTRGRGAPAKEALAARRRTFALDRTAAARSAAQASIAASRRSPPRRRCPRASGSRATVRERRAPVRRAAGVRHRRRRTDRRHRQRRPRLVRALEPIRRTPDAHVARVRAGRRDRGWIGAHLRVDRARPVRSGAPAGGILTHRYGVETHAVLHAGCSTSSPEWSKCCR